MVARMRSRKIRAIKGYRSTPKRLLQVRGNLRNRKFVAGIVVVILLAVILFTYLFNRYYRYDDYKVISSIKIESTENSKYVPFGNFVVKYSNDGISYIDGKETRWDEAYEMKTPIIDVCGDYLAIADKNTNDIFIYDTEGRRGTVTVSYPIIKLEVASQGVVAAMQEEQNANYIEAYDVEGNQLIAHKTLIDENGYPLNFSLSDDGLQMMVSYLSVNNGSFHNKVVFYDFSKNGKKYDNRISGSFEQYGETLVPSVSFVSENRAVAVGEDMISVYSVSGQPQLKNEISLTHQIDKVFMNEDYIGITYTTENHDNPYTIEVYNMSGKKVITANTSLNFEHADFAGDNVLIFDDLNCKIISLNGVEKFNYTFEGEITEMIPLEDAKEFLLITNSEIQKIRLK